jgi:tyrosine-protein kinase Etk/Wzc
LINAFINLINEVEVENRFEIPKQNNQQFEQSSLRDYIRILMNRKWLILFVMMTTILAVGLWTYMIIPVYEAEISLLYEEPQDTMFALDVGQPFYNKSAIVNLTELIMSRAIAEKVAAALPSQVIRTFRMPDPMPIDISSPKIISRIIRANLSVQTVRGSDILKIQVQANDPFSAMTIANTYAYQVIDWNLQKKRMEISSVGAFIDKQLKVFQEKLDFAEDALKKFKEENKIISLSESSTDLLSRLTVAETAYNQAKAEREALEQRKQYLELKKQELAPSLTVISNPTAQQLKQEILNLERRCSNLKLENKLENQTEILSLQKQIESFKQKLVQELLDPTLRKNLVDPLSQIRTILQELITLEIDIETYKVRELAMKNIADNYNNELQKIPKHELDLARLIRDREVDNQIYTMLLERREEARITEAGKLGDIQIIDSAEQPRFPIKPNKMKNMAVGLILGFSFGVGLAFFLESLDTSLKSQDDVEKKIGIPVLTSIPTIQTNGKIKLFHKQAHQQKYYNNKLLSECENLPHIYEPYRTLQLNFSFMNVAQKYRTLLITSPGAGAGKTLNSINLAQLFARDGSSTLLLDCDLRRPMVHKILELPQKPGLTDLLINKFTLEEVVLPQKNSNLFILTSGTLPPNPSDLLNTPQMDNLLNEMKSRYEFIILDSPPVISVTDALILGSKVDGVFMVLKSGETSLEAALRAKEILEKSGIKIIGAILNSVNFKDVYHYYKDYYYYSNTKKTMA